MIAPLPASPLVPLTRQTTTGATATKKPVEPEKRIAKVVGGSVLHEGVPRAEITTPLPEPGEPAEPPKQLVVKLVTDDPNIVIYWLLDQKTGGTL